MSPSLPAALPRRRTGPAAALRRPRARISARISALAGALRPAASAALALLLLGAGPAAGFDLLIRSEKTGEARSLSLADLDKLDQDRIVTGTPWTEGRSVFDGVSGKALAALAPKGATEVHAVGLNDYAYTVPLADFASGQAIIATRRDGAEIPLRDKGPFWIMYPFDDLTNRDRLPREPRAVWHLKTLIFR